MSGPVFSVEYGGYCFWCGAAIAYGEQAKMFEGRMHCAAHDLADEDEDLALGPPTPRG